MVSIFGSGDVARKAQIQDLQRQLDEVKRKVAEKERELLPWRYRVAKMAQEAPNILYSWKAPSRIFVRRGKQWYWTVALTTMTIIVILAFFQEAILIAAVIAFIFVLYVMVTVPPGKTEYKITEFGIETGEGENAETYTWDQLDSFWVAFRQGREVLNIDTKISFPTRITLLFEEADKPKIIKIFAEKLPYKEPPKRQSWFSRQTEGIYIPYNEVKQGKTVPSVVSTQPPTLAVTSGQKATPGTIANDTTQST